MNIVVVKLDNPNSSYGQSKLSMHAQTHALFEGGLEDSAEAAAS